jgi:hypothetical protein
MLRVLLVIVLMMWFIGFMLHLAGSLIHLLLVVALGLLLVDLFTPKPHVD